MRAATGGRGRSIAVGARGDRVRDALLRRMVKRHIGRRVRGVWTPEEAEEEETRKGFPYLEELERRLRTAGRSEGTVFALTRIVERGLRRALTEAEREALRRRLALRGDGVLALETGAVGGWLARLGD